MSIQLYEVERCSRDTCFFYRWGDAKAIHYCAIEGTIITPTQSEQKWPIWCPLRGNTIVTERKGEDCIDFR